MPVKEKKTCIVGTGGFARETLLCIKDALDHEETNQKLSDIVCFMENDAFYKESHIMGVEVIKESNFDPELYEVVVAIGDPKTRKRVIENLPKETSYTSIIHPNAVISEWVSIGKGAIITAGVILTCNISIGNHTQLNLHTTIGHDCSIGDFFTSAPGVNISGECSFGELVYFGTNACVRQGVKICDNVTIGMGGVVIKDITESGVYIGNPLKKLA